MGDDVGDGGGFDDSEEENQDIVDPKDKIIETTEKIVAEKSSLGLPMNGASDAWMDDVGDGSGFDDSEEETEERPQIDIPKEKSIDLDASESKSIQMKELSQTQSLESNLRKHLSLDSFWLNKFQIDDAEKKLFELKIQLRIDEVKDRRHDNSDDDDSDRAYEPEQGNPEKKSRSQEEKEVSSYLPDLEQSDFSWTDESAYLKPNIPVLKPLTFKMTSMHKSVQVESSVSNSAKFLSSIIKGSVQKSDNFSHENQVSPLKVSLSNLQSSTDNLEETLQRLSSEDLDSQFALVQFTLKSIGDLETEANRIEKELIEEKNNEIDFMTLSANLTSCKTKLVTLHTEADNVHSKIIQYRDERRKRLNEIKRYQTLLIDLEQWLGEAQSTISTDMKLTTVKIVRDQIRASEVLALELNARSSQLEGMIGEIDNLVSYTDVEPLVDEMKGNLKTLLKVMEEAQQCLDLKLKNLQVELKDMESSIDSEISEISETDKNTNRTETETLLGESEIQNEEHRNIEISFSKNKNSAFTIGIPEQLEIGDLQQELTQDGSTLSEEKSSVSFNGSLEITVLKATDLQKK